MKRYVRWIGLTLILASVLLPMTAFAQGNQPEIPTPPPAGTYVLDTLEWLTPQQEADINAVVSKLDSEKLAEIAVVTLDDCGGDKQKFRNDLFREWGIGHADDNDGLLIMICWSGGDKSQRSLEQEVGYGLEGTIPDLLTSKVAKQYFVPAFSTGVPDNEVVWTGKAGEALVTMVKAYDGVIRGNTPAELQQQPMTEDEAWAQLLSSTFLGLSCGLWIIILIVLLFAFLFWAQYNGYIDLSSTSSGSSSGSSSSSSSSDSGSSFGGGSSGGGGSSTGF